MLKPLEPLDLRNMNMPDASANSATQERRRLCPMKGKDFDLSCRLRIIIDTSVYIDLFAERSEKRMQLTEKLFNYIKSKENSVRLYGPRLLFVELACVLIRYIPPRAVTDLLPFQFYRRSFCRGLRPITPIPSRGLGVIAFIIAPEA